MVGLASATSTIDATTSPCAPTALRPGAIGGRARLPVARWRHTRWRGRPSPVRRARPGRPATPRRCCAARVSPPRANRDRSRSRGAPDSQRCPSLEAGTRTRPRPRPLPSPPAGGAAGRGARRVRLPGGERGFPLGRGAAPRTTTTQPPRPRHGVGAGRGTGRGDSDEPRWAARRHNSGCCAHTTSSRAAGLESGPSLRPLWCRQSTRWSRALVMAT